MIKYFFPRIINHGNTSRGAERGAFYHCQEGQRQALPISSVQI